MTDKKEILFYFRKEDYGWLSNFERAYVIIDSIPYRTNEHYYQSQKAIDPYIKAWVRNAPNPFLAMIAGRGLRSKEMKPNWDEIKVGIMFKGLRAKFTQNPDLREKLLATGNAILHENSPTDMFWGIKGKDMLGILLMKLREILKY